MRCYRKILCCCISYKDHVTNIQRAKIQQAIGPHEDLLTIIKRCKLQWYGHVSRSSGLAKTILQGKVTGGRRQGRHRKRWEDNIREWTDLEFARSQRTVENREKWRKLVVKSSVVPQWSLQLRDRWWWWSLVAKGSEDKVETVIFWLYMSPNSEFDLEVSTPIFFQEPWLTMMHHHTKFGYKRFGGSEVMVWTNIH